jgi:hypothetical protein
MECFSLVAVCDFLNWGLNPWRPARARKPSRTGCGPTACLALCDNQRVVASSCRNISTSAGA